MASINIHNFHHAVTYQYMWEAVAACTFLSCQQRFYQLRNYLNYVNVINSSILQIFPYWWFIPWLQAINIWIKFDHNSSYCNQFEESDWMWPFTFLQTDWIWPFIFIQKLRERERESFTSLTSRLHGMGKPSHNIIIILLFCLSWCLFLFIHFI